MKSINISSKRKKLDNIKKEFPGAQIIDVTSKATLPWQKFSPFFPVGNIPIPLSDGHFSQTIEGMWQGLKVFENHDIDLSRCNITNMKNIKRTVRKYGRVLGHKRGVEGTVLLTYIEARQQIYVPAYNYVLEHFLTPEIEKLTQLLQEQDLVLLDYETNEDILNPRKPLSHASLIAKFITKNY